MTELYPKYAASTGRAQRAAFIWDAQVRSAGQAAPSIRARARACGVHERTGRRWARRVSVESRRPGPPPGTGARPLCAELSAVVCLLRRKYRLSREEITCALGLEDFTDTLGPEGRASDWQVRRCLETHDLGRLPRPGADEADMADAAEECEGSRGCQSRGSFAPTVPGFLHLDTLYGPEVPGRGRWYLYVAVERTSRWVHIGVYPTRGASDGAAFLREVLRRCPLKIHTLLTDNGSEWMAEFTRLTDESGVQHRHTRAHSPQTNGMVERMNRLLREKTPLCDPALWAVRPEERVKPAEGLLPGRSGLREQQRLNRLRAEAVLISASLNLLRPRRCLGWKTPQAVLVELYRQDPGLFHRDPHTDVPADLDQYLKRLGAQRFRLPAPGLRERLVRTDPSP